MNEIDKVTQANAGASEEAASAAEQLAAQAAAMNDVVMDMQRMVEGGKATAITAQQLPPRTPPRASAGKMTAAPKQIRHLPAGTSRKKPANNGQIAIPARNHPA